MKLQHEGGKLCKKTKIAINSKVGLGVKRRMKVTYLKTKKKHFVRRRMQFYALYGKLTTQVFIYDSHYKTLKAVFLR